MSALAKRLSLRRKRRQVLADRTRGGPSNADPGFWLSDRIKDALGGSTINRPYAQHPWVYRAADVISTSLTQAPFGVVRGPEDDPQPVTTGPWAEFFRKPSPWLSQADFWTATWLYQLLPPGDAFWVLFSQIGELVATPRDVPRFAYPVSGATMKEALDKGTGLLAGWMWSVDKQRIPLERWQVVQFGKIDPWNQWRRQSPLEAATRSMRTDHKAAVWNEALLDNGADPGVILKMPGLHGDQVEETRRQWEDRHKGAAKQGRLAVLTGERDDVIRTTLTHTEMGYKDMRKMSQEEIASVYGVPLFVMGQLDDVRLETSEASLKLFWELTLLGWLRLGASAVNTQLIGTRGGGAELSMISENENAVRGRFFVEEVSALKRDAEQRRRIALADRDLGFSRNEVNARHELGYETEDALGDVSLVRMGLERLEDVEAEPADPADFGLPAFGGAATPVEDEETPAPDESENNSEPPSEDEADEEDRASFSTTSTRRASLAREVEWNTYIREVHKPGEARFRGRMRSYFNQRRAEILRFLKDVDEKASGDPRKREVTSVEMEMWLSAQQERWDTLLVDQTEPVYKGIMKTSLDRLGQQIGGLTSASMESPAVQQVLLERQQMIVGVNATLAKQLRFSILEGISQQEGITGLEARIKHTMKVADHRAAAIARTETGSASTGARFAGYKEEGITKHSWLTAGDEFVRESHMIDGQVREVGEDFSNGLAYPLEAGAPADEVINCRCDTLPED